MATRKNHSIDNNLRQKAFCKYDSSNHLIEQYEDSISPYNSESKDIYTYDTEGKIISHEQSSKSFKTIITYKYKYDNKGNWIKKSQFVNGKLNMVIKQKIEYYE